MAIFNSYFKLPEGIWYSHLIPILLVPCYSHDILIFPCLFAYHASLGEATHPILPLTAIIFPIYSHYIPMLVSLYHDIPRCQKYSHFIPLHSHDLPIAFLWNSPFFPETDIPIISHLLWWISQNIPRLADHLFPITFPQCEAPQL